MGGHEIIQFYIWTRYLKLNQAAIIEKGLGSLAYTCDCQQMKYRCRFLILVLLLIIIQKGFRLLRGLMCFFQKT